MSQVLNGNYHKFSLYMKSKKSKKQNCMMTLEARATGLGKEQEEVGIRVTKSPLAGVKSGYLLCSMLAVVHLRIVENTFCKCCQHKAKESELFYITIRFI